jgi:hypothetical protein
MSWYLDFKKYKKQIKELLFVRSELEYQEELLSETHPIFEDYYRNFCIDNRIDLDYLHKNNDESIENVFNHSEQKRDKLIHKPRKEKKNPTKVFDKIYREIAKEIHPDKLSSSLSSEEAKEKEELFKKATGAMNKEDWGHLLEVADWLNIKPRSFDGIEEQVRLEITKLKYLIENNKNMYSWEFAQCETDHERDEVVVKFLFHLFGYIVDNSD